MGSKLRTEIQGFGFPRISTYVVTLSKKLSLVPKCINCASINTPGTRTDSAETAGYRGVVLEHRNWCFEAKWRGIKISEVQGVRNTL
jgi:hypothetical protein